MGVFTSENVSVKTSNLSINVNESITLTEAIITTFFALLLVMSAVTAADGGALVSLSSSNINVNESVSLSESISTSISDLEISGWLYRKKITIDSSKIDDTLTNFPVTVLLTSANFNFNNARSDGFDIRFTASDGNALLKYERVSHDDAEETAEYHVKIPSIASDVDTVFYMYYGKSDADDGADPEAVWDDNFVMVQHMKDATTSTITDSTQYGNNGTKKGANEPIEAAGKIGKAQSFDGSDDYINMGNVLNMGLGDFTIAGWVKLDSTVGNYLRLIDKYTTAGYIVRSFSSDIYFTARGANDAGAVDFSYAGSRIPIDNNQWMRIAFVIDRTGTSMAMTPYKNGVVRTPQTLTVDGSLDNTGNFLLYSIFDKAGLMDEVRISNIARSAAWIKGEFNSGNDSLLTYGSAETLTIVELVTINESVSSSISNSQINVGESVTITESISSVISDPQINVSESILLGESITLLQYSQIDVSDSVILTEFTFPSISDAQTSVNELVTVAEFITSLVSNSQINVNELVILTESIFPLISDSQINVNELVILTESIFPLISDSQINVNESVSLAENLKIVLLPLISVSDSITISETASLGIDNGKINVNDSTALTESVASWVFFPASTSDAVSLGELVSLKVSAPQANVSDEILVTDGSQEIVPYDVVIHLPLNQASLVAPKTLLDASENENDGLSYNIPSFAPDQNNQVNGALSLNGINDYLTCPDFSSLYFGNDSFTILSQIYSTKNLSGWFQKGRPGTSGTVGIQVRAESTRLYINIRDNLGNSKSDYLDCGFSILNQWKFFVLLVDRSSAEIKLYVNNNLIGDSIDISNITGSITTSSSLEIGRRGNNSYFGGSLANFRGYTKLLSTNEIDYFYKGSPQAEISTLNINVSNSVSLSESINASRCYNLSAFENINLAESVNIILPDAEVLSVNDEVSVSESIDANIERSRLVSDAASVNEIVIIEISNLETDTNDLVSTTESIVVETTNLIINVGDSVELSETAALVFGLDIKISDLSSITEIVNLSVSDESVDVSDLVLLSESVGINPVFNLDVDDSAALSESIEVVLSDLDISINENISLSESIASKFDTEEIDVNELVIITESTLVSFEFGIVVNESVSITENININLVNLINVSDSATLTESITVELFDEDISVSDSVSLAESITAELDNFEISISELVSLAESVVSPIIAFTIEISESVTVDEAVISNLGSFVDVSDTVSLSEIITAETSDFEIDINDSVNISESVLKELVSLISVAEAVSITELAALAISNLRIFVDDLVALSESISTSIVAQGAMSVTFISAKPEMLFTSKTPGVSFSAKKPKVSFS